MNNHTKVLILDANSEHACMKGKKYRFVSTHDLNKYQIKYQILLLTCASTYELPSKLNSMDYTIYTLIAGAKLTLIFASLLFDLFKAFD